MAYKVIRVDGITVAQGYACPKCKIIWPHYYSICPLCKVDIIENKKSNNVLSFISRVRGILSRRNRTTTRDSKKNIN